MPVKAVTSAHEDADIDCTRYRALNWQTRGLRNLRGPLARRYRILHQPPAHKDAVLAMYHDQGLPVLKYAGFRAMPST